MFKKVYLHSKLKILIIPPTVGEREKFVQFFSQHPNVDSVPETYSFVNKYILKYFILN